VSTTPPPDPLTMPWRPTVDDVAALIRSRTKDAAMNEVGTFTADTRPTDAEVEQLITNGMAKIASRVGWDLPADSWPEAVHLVALFAACEAELSYFPEQIRTDRSAYQQLWEIFTYDLDAFVEMVANLDPTTLAAGEGTVWTPSATVLWAWQNGWGVPFLSDVVNVGLGPTSG